MNDTRRSLADRIRDKLAAHDLPREQPLKTAGGYGRGEPCDACDEAIQKAQVEYQIDALGDRTYRLHLGCYGRWAAEIYRGRWTATASPAPSPSGAASRARQAVTAMYPTDVRKDGIPMVNVSISTATAGMIRSWPYHKEERLEEATLAAMRTGSNVTTYDARNRAATRWCFTCTARQAEDLQGWLDKSAAKLEPARRVMAEDLARAAADVGAALQAASAPTG